MNRAHFRPYVATAAIIAGAALLLVTANSAVDAVRVARQVYSSTPNIHDTYFVVPQIRIGLFIYAAGVLGDLAFRAMSVTLGRPARVLWQTHFVVTTLLILIASALNSGRVIAADWQTSLLVNGIYVLMLLAHGAALVAAGILFIRRYQV